MNVTTTRGRHADTQVTSPVKRNREVQLDESFGPLLEELSEVRMTKAAAEAREKEIKDLLKAEVGPNADKLETLVVRIAGVIRAKVTLQSKKGVDAKLLKESFPEAYSVCETETEYQVLKPA
jgi:hypothetical protein